MRHLLLLFSLRIRVFLVLPKESLLLMYVLDHLLDLPDVKDPFLLSRGEPVPCFVSHSLSPSIGDRERPPPLSHLLQDLPLPETSSLVSYLGTHR